jgi:hypothetical protein
MTVLRLKDRRILVHSPVPIEPDLRSAVENLGQLAALIAPNLFHHQFISEWISAFPEAKAFCAPGLAAKRSDIKLTECSRMSALPNGADKLTNS